MTVGGFYFKVDNPNLVKEARVQYYNNSSSYTSNISWKTQTIPNQGDGEFAGFVLPKTKYTNVRGYVKTAWGDIIYTSTYTITYAGNNGLYAYYNSDGSNIASADENGNYSDEENFGEDKEGVEINFAFLVPVAIFVGGFALGAVSDYYCELNGGKFYLPNTWYQNNTINFGCAISAGTTIVGVAALGRTAVKIGVTKYSSKAVVETTAKSLGKNVDDVAKLGNTIGGLNFSPIAYSHMLEKARYVPDNILKMVIQNTKGYPDPRGTSSLMYYSKVYINGKNYNLEVLYEYAKNKIRHFKYTSEAIGNLPAIK